MLALLAGVAVGCAWRVPSHIVIDVVCLTWGLALTCLLVRSTVWFVGSTLVAFAVCGAALGMSAMWDVVHTPARAALMAAHGVAELPDEPSGIVEVTGRLTEDAAPSSSGGARLAMESIGFDIGGRPLVAGGGILLTVVGTVAPSMATTWRRGRVVRVPAQLRRPARYLDPGVPDFELMLARRGVTLVGSAKSGLLVEVIARGSVFDEACAELRARARDVFDRVIGRYGARSAAVTRAVILGDRTGLDEETEERLQRAGTYHVIAISGGNIAILAGLLFVAVRLVTRMHVVPEVVVSVCLIGYAFLVGGGASVARATVMAVVLLAAHAFDGRGHPLNALACAAGLSLAIEPLMIYDAGAWLTYGATLAIIVGTPLAFATLPPLPGWLRPIVALFVASLAAELALFPISAMVFSRVTTAGLALNFAAIPLMTVVQVGGMCVLGLAAVSALAANLAGYVTHVAAWGLVESARFVDLVPWLTTRLPPPEAVAMATYYLAWLVFFASRPGIATLQRGRAGARRSQEEALSGEGTEYYVGAVCGRGLTTTPFPLRARQVAIMAVVATGIWIVVAPNVRWGAAGRLRVTFIDVGQGDATLVEFPSGHAWMVDAGGATGPRFDIARRVIEPVVWTLGVRQLAHLVLTHGDADHIGGAPSIVRDLVPDEVWEGIPVPKHEPLTQLRDLTGIGGSVWRSVQRGDRVRIGGVDVIVWHPPPADWERQRVRNDDSIVIELRYGNVSIVLPGDVEAPSEKALARLLAPAPITIVQAPHHGSPSSSSLPLLQAMSPAVVVMSVGRNNRFGHPGRAVLERYRAIGAGVFRTDQDGAVTIDTDGKTADVTSFTGRRQHLTPAAPRAAPPA
ncbi:MAG: ComEC/Rec2 family competence protein [Acidobacteria bacterium]|nr:ComEC/Rec2 family competence protein [Acidobacteriota bacterium]